MVEWKHYEYLVLEKNENYWDADNVSLEKITIPIVYSSHVLSFSNDRVDTALIYNNYTEFEEDYTTQINGIMYYLSLNTKNQVLSNTNIRKALLYGFDKQRYLYGVDNALVATGLIPSNIPGPEGQTFRQANGDLAEYDVEKAKEYLALGLKELGLTEMPSLRYVGGYSNYKIIKDIYKEIGITIDHVPVNSYWEQLDYVQSGDFDISFFGWIPDFYDPMSYLGIFETNNDYNNGKWSNAEFDEIINFASNTTDYEARMDKLLEAERILIDEAAVIPLYFGTNTILTKPNVTGFVTHSYGYDFSWKWVKIK